MACEHYGNLTICRPNSWKVFSRKPAGVKWCFSCRRHLPHDWIVHGEDGITYYDPIARYDCTQCHQDHTLGFGMVREWEEL
jgi:hypothetical protein